MTIERIQHYFSDDYARYHGVLGIFAGVFGLTVFALAIYLHSRTEHYSFFTHFVSSLGWGPNGADLVFRYGLVMLAVLITPFVLFLFTKLRSDSVLENDSLTEILAYVGLVSFLFAGLGLVLLSVFGDVRQPSFVLHVVGAPVYFLMSLVGLIAFSFALLINNHIGKEPIAAALFVAGMYVAFFASASSLSELGIGETVRESRLLYDMSAAERIEFVRTIIEAAPWMGFFEWMAVLSTLAWFISVGRYTLR